MADEFEYNKNLNILEAEGSIEVIDVINNCNMLNRMPILKIKI